MSKVIRVKKSEVAARRKARKDKMESASISTALRRGGRREPSTIRIMTSNRSPGYLYK